MLKAQAIVTLWDGQTPGDATGNQLWDVYKKQGMKLQLAWVDLPELFGWKLPQPEGKPDITLDTIFSERYLARVFKSQLWDTRHASRACLH